VGDEVTAIRAVLGAAAGLAVAWRLAAPQPAPVAVVAAAPAPVVQNVGTSAQVPTLSPGTLARPYATGEPWKLTQGPHYVLGWDDPGTPQDDGSPAVAVDFMPPDAEWCTPTAPTGGSFCQPDPEHPGYQRCVPCDCRPSALPVRAVAPGAVDAVGPGWVSLLLTDGRAVLYFHVEDAGRAAVGTTATTGDPLGFVGCTYGATTGAHVHLAIARDGVWLPTPEEWRAP